MTREQKLSAKLIYFSIAYGTNFSYLMIVLLMIFSNDLHSGSEIRLLLTFLIPAAFTVFFSTIILRRSLENESDVKKIGITI